MELDTYCNFIFYGLTLIHLIYIEIYAWKKIWVSTRYFMEKYRSGDFSGLRATVMLASPATVPHLYLLLRGFEPQTFSKRFGVHPLTTWAKLPFDI